MYFEAIDKFGQMVVTDKKKYAEVAVAVTLEIDREEVAQFKKRLEKLLTDFSI